MYQITSKCFKYIYHHTAGGLYFSGSKENLCSNIVELFKKKTEQIYT